MLRKYPDVPPGTLLTTKVHAPAGLTTYALSNTTMTALDTTNATLAFTVPPSGQVLVTVQCEAQLTTPAGSGGTIGVALLNHSGGAQLGFTVNPLAWGVAAVSSPISTVNFAFLLTGLTPGALQVDVAGSVAPNAVGVSGNIYAQGYTGLANGSKTSPLTIIAYAA